MSRKEWLIMTMYPKWIDRFDAGDIIKVYHPDGKVFRYKIVNQKIAQPL